MIEVRGIDHKGSGNTFLKDIAFKPMTTGQEDIMLAIGDESGETMKKD